WVWGTGAEAPLGRRMGLGSGYEQFKLGYKQIVGGRDLSTAECGGMGALAGVVTGALTTPLDVIKTRLMIQGSSGQYLGVADCARQILETEGPGAFLKGLQPRVTWIGIGGCIFFATLEKSKELLVPKE
ncbi:hypothetical protein CYMTET_21885, partial [Cymbomonas tetramitiformis]